MKRSSKFYRLLIISAAAIPLSVASTKAQNLNIDFGTGFGGPLPGYGGPAVRPGVWNILAGPGAFPVVDLSGAPTAATVSVGGIGVIACAGVPVVSPHARLFDDGINLGPVIPVPAPITCTIGPLAGGVYDVYTCAWAPCMPAYRTIVNVLGSADPAQLVGGVLPPFGGSGLGVTHARHNNVIIAPGGYVNIQLTPAVGFGTLNGIQLVRH